MEKTAVWAKFEKSLDDKVVKMAEKLSMTKSSTIGLCTSIGLSLLSALINPESLISAEKMAEVMIEAEKKGVEFMVPDDELAEYGY